MRFNHVRLLLAGFLPCFLLTLSCGHSSKSPLAPPGSITLTGRVVKDGTGVPGALVRIIGTGVDSILTTGQDGSYSIAGIEYGLYTIIPGKSGYQFDPPELELDVSDSSSTATIPSLTAREEPVRVPVTIENITFAPIPGGAFLMGSREGLPDERPAHMVKLDSFSMSATEITQAQYLAVTGGKPSYTSGKLTLPVEQVSWLDAVHFCNLLSDKAGRNRCYNEATGECDFSQNGFRLPTEAEWEYACRAGSFSLYSTGDTEDDLARTGWFIGNGSGTSIEVARKEPNPWGLYDMHGNVWELCNDWYADNYYAISPETNPHGAASGHLRVMRGGGWFSSPLECRASSRQSCAPDFRYFRIGFRIVTAN